jgi:alpha-D-xyloside xylohydrolase
MFEVNGDGVVWRGDGETLDVRAWGPHSLRVRSRLMGELLDTDYALLPPQPAAVDVTLDADVAVVRNGRIEVVLRSSRGTPGGDASPEPPRCELEFRTSTGRTLLKEQSQGGSLKLKARRFQAVPGGDHRLTASFESDPGEKLFGMGQYQQHLLDLKGCTFELAHRNSQASVPFVLSSAGYGFFWHDPSIGRATFGLNRTEWHAESTRQLDYWITAGDDPAQIVRAYTAATGRPPKMPEHGLGFWQCKLRYWNAEQLLDVAREHVRRGLPLDVLVCDFFHWPRMGDYRFDEEYFPDPRAMVAELASMGVELMVSVWPQVALTSENYEEMRDNNLLVRSESGVDVQMRFQEPSVFFDATSPAARRYVWEKCRQHYYDLGVRTFWLDEAEPEYESYDPGQYRYHLGPDLRVGNLYPQLYARGFYEGQVAAGQADPVNLVRCAWAGSQRYGALVWSGDISSTWEDFRRQITAGLHMGIAGLPWWTTDIGGFYGGDPGDEGFRELLVRWFQWGAFCPVMRLHGLRLPVTPITHADGRPNCPTGADNEVWSYGEEVYDILTSYLHLRERMRPYVREVMRQAHELGDPVLRPMFYGYPDDERSWTLEDQYLFGPDLLVAPIVEPGARARDVYLPRGTWTELHSGRMFDGGQVVPAQAPLPVIPVFARDDTHPELVGRI